MAFLPCLARGLGGSPRRRENSPGRRERDERESTAGYARPSNRKAEGGLRSTRSEAFDQDEIHVGARLAQLDHGGVFRVVVPRPRVVETATLASPSASRA